MRRGMYVALGVLVFLATLTPASDTDLWWHLAAGREMLARGSFLTSDPFTLSAAGRPWIDLHWLFQLSVYGIYQWFGLTGLVVAKALLVTAGALVLLAVVERGTTAAAVARPLFVLAMGAAMFFARHLVLVRPVVFTLVFLALFVWLLEGFARGDNPRRLWWLPVLQVIWVNSQGLFALGPAVILCYAVGGALGQRLGTRELPERGARRLFAVTALCLAVCLLTPYGVAGLLLPIKLLLRLAPSDSNVFSANIAENVPPWVLQRSAPGLMAPFHWALGLVGASFIVARRQVLIGRTLLVLAFAGLALLANRNVLLFFWLATPIAVLNVAPALARVLDGLAARGRTGAVKYGGAAAALTGFAGLLALIGVARAHETAIAQPAPFRVPAAAVQHLPAQPPAGRAGRVFTADHYGGYLTWALYPRYLPFIDTRLVLHTGDEYEEFLGLLDNPERWDEWQRRQQFDHVLVPSAFPDRYLGLIRHLAASPDWRLVFTDGTQVLFSHSPGGWTRPGSRGCGGGARNPGPSGWARLGPRRARTCGPPAPGPAVVAAGTHPPVARRAGHLARTRRRCAGPAGALVPAGGRRRPGAAAGRATAGPAPGRRRSARRAEPAGVDRVVARGCGGGAGLSAPLVDHRSLRWRGAVNARSARG